jgi:hypothetical protein
MSNFVPVVAWGLCPGGSNTEVANYFGSWGLNGALPSSSPVVATYYGIPVHPTIPTFDSFARGWICSLIIAWMLYWR